MTELAPGVLVRCVDDSGDLDDGDLEQWPVRGCIYTVRKLDGTAAVWLVEIVNELHQWRDEFGEASFRISRFTPIDDSAIDVLRSALTDVPQRETEAA